MTDIVQQGPADDRRPSGRRRRGPTVGVAAALGLGVLLTAGGIAPSRRVDPSGRAGAPDAAGSVHPASPESSPAATLAAAPTSAGTPGLFEPVAGLALQVVHVRGGAVAVARPDHPYDAPNDVYFLPFDGAPRRIGAATSVVPAHDPAYVWLVRWGAGGMVLRRIRASSGQAGRTLRLDHHGSVVGETVDGMVVTELETPAGSELVDVRTGRSRPVALPYGTLLTASYAVVASGGGCGGHCLQPVVYDVRTGDTRQAAAVAGVLVDEPAVSDDGRTVLYLFRRPDGDTGLRALDVDTARWRAVPPLPEDGVPLVVRWGADGAVVVLLADPDGGDGADSVTTAVWRPDRAGWEIARRAGSRAPGLDAH